MESFASILQRAQERKGGAAALEALLPEPASSAELVARADDRYLAEMTACVFRSGFVWQIIERKWPAFEEVFNHFDVTSAAMLSDEDLERLATDERIVRNGAKIRSVRENAHYVTEVRAVHGSFGAYLAAWPRGEFVSLWDELKRRGARLGGQTGRFFLRFVGWDTPILSNDVVAALISQGVIDKAPTSKKSLQAVQDAFNTWAAESGRPFCQISRVLAASIG